MEFIDAHFHIWDTTDAARTGQSVDNLGMPGKTIPQYSAGKYKEDLAEVKGLNMKCKGCVWVECLSTIPLAEASWASGECLKLLSGPLNEFKIVARCDLSDEDVRKRLRRLNTVPDLTGIRQILNHHPTESKLTYPLVERGDYMQDEDWLEGFRLLGDLGLSFDLQVYPHQLEEFAAVARRYPNTNTVLNHLGMLSLKEPSVVDTWRKGMRALAECDNVSVKISMLDYIIPDWIRDKAARREMRDYVREVIELFGPHRCMFGSNFPVEKCTGYAMGDLYSAFQEFVSDLDEESKKQLFYGTAYRFYKFEE
ncbi:uncharacterized protein y4mH-like [Ptychodera flava]|uniref:uncharacterized protein y4mH-like n=1 Tax=Ptychodera flava TaxID=63121 RepID=UPI00396AAAF2